jgi:hypothetical protein
MKRILALDPGVNGGIAWRDENGITQAEPMPEGMSAQADFIRRVAAANPGIVAVLERTGTYMPGNSGVAAATFARHCGALEAMLYCIGIPAEQVTPQRWQKHFGTLPKEKPERKRAIKEIMARRYPHLTVTLKVADALALLTFYAETKGDHD